MMASNEQEGQQPSAPGDSETGTKKVPLFKKIFRLLEGMFALIGVLFVIYHAGFNVSVVYTDSMAPTLIGENSRQRDVVLTERVSYWFRKPHRWEVVKYRTPNELHMEVMKRVVALPGETISIKDHWVQINGRPVQRPSSLDFLKYYAYGNLHRGKAMHCEDGYFVMGDDSKDSADSRFDGTISLNKLEGRVWLVIWPLSRLGFVTP
ncbi:MAG: signal peptidase I [Planctomycetota bacterium]|jgi:signal peptidase I